MSHPIEILERYWNHTSFRPFQEDIINAVLNNEDTFALLPTGGGKSICFQIPALIKDGICIVISPLVALMKDQVNALNQKGIKAMAITSGLSFSDLDTLLDNCIYGNYKFLYISPERLQQTIVQERIQQMNVNLIAVDEAHCISQWGNDFRPAYRNINILRQLQPSVNVIALTATAKPEVVKDIIDELHFIAPKIFRGSFNRSNLALHIINAEDKHYQLEKILKKHKGSSIIYVRSRRATTDTHKFLESKGFSCTFFHGGITSKEKHERLEQWLHNRKEIMIATSAFGMGIDKPDVKMVIHLNLPESIESYYQEIGRAGRNNEKSYAVILNGKADEQQLKNQFLKTSPDVDFIKLVYRKLCNYFQISYGEGEQTQHQLDFNDFCKAYDFKSATTFNALKMLDKNSIITLSQQFNYQTKLQFIIPNKALFGYLERQTHQHLIIKSILRTYGGIFEHLLKINIRTIASKASTTEEDVLHVLQQLKKDEVVEFQFSNTDSEITFLEPREDDKTINRIAKEIEQQNELRSSQVNAVIDYINNDRVCKRIQLLNYFGELSSTPCENCSVCLKKNQTKSSTDIKTIKNGIIIALEEQPLTSRALIELLPFNKHEVLDVLRLMLEHNIIELTNTNRYKIKHT
ncbi:recombinase RecQ [Flavobacteriales bacterium 34_180_T64]|nr:recombinase RecQ [Flavobacteriales bacterium 34_180_T64]